ncbi:DUF6600 domain-containing protein [Haloferula sp.]|uniref:DUF6600 domain-containing protein n=1 Tax=Haloferula sp. TaxID=2497595 RepID=UPI003C714FDE
MKNQLLFPLFLTLAFGACQRPDSESEASQDAGNLEEQAAVEALEIERARVQAEREALSAEREALRMEREAQLAAKEQELLDREADLARQDEEARLAAEALAAEQAELDRREQELSEVELGQAGTTVIDDWTVDEPEVVQEPVEDFSLFYDELEPYGDWFETPDYGYVYQPTVVIQNQSWRPYVHGRWVCSNLGWTWRSDEPFGWATFHYGRWALLAGRGWCWVPGSEWAPSWCAWREGNGHVGWAPLPPETLAYRKRGWGSGVDVDLGIASSCFNFVESRHMAASLASHRLPTARNRYFLQNTRGCTNIQYQGNRIIAGGPSYAEIHKAVKEPWPVRRLELDSIGRGKGDRDYRRGVERGNHLKLFAPSLDAPWNPKLRPRKVADSWGKVEVVRADGGLKETWSRRLEDARERQQANAQQWAQKNEDLRQSRELQLQRNREAVAAAQARVRENMSRQANLRRGNPRVPDQVESVPARGERRERPTVARVPATNATPAGVETTPDLKPKPQALPRGVSRTDRRDGPTAVVPSPGRPETSASQVNERIEEMRKRQAAARERAVDQKRAVQAVPEAQDRQPQASGPSMKERLAEARQKQEVAASERAADQARAKAEMQEKLRQQQEKVRLAQEQAKQEQQRKIQEQQERIRAIQEKAKQDQAERARQRAEQARQKEMADRQAAEQAAREKQAAAQRAAEQRARQQEELARRQEEARQAAQEKARQDQERAREAAEQRARQQEQNLQRIREAQEKMRERVREQQEQRKGR